MKSLGQKRKTPYNSTYNKLVVQCSADTFAVAESSVLRMKFSAKNPALRVAANVSYFSLTNLTGSAETYPLAREHAVAAARILYGRCSYVENQVCRAWSACNIGPYCEPCEIITPCWTYGCGNSQSPMMGIEDLNNRTSKIDIYPNPATDILNIKFTDLTHFELENGIFNIVILDMLGRTKMSKTVSNDDLENGLSISHLTSGVYSIVISNNSGFSQTLKFVKQ